MMVVLEAFCERQCSVCSLKSLFCAVTQFDTFDNSAEPLGKSGEDIVPGAGSMQ